MCICMCVCIYIYAHTHTYIYLRNIWITPYIYSSIVCIRNITNDVS